MILYILLIIGIIIVGSGMNYIGVSLMVEAFTWQGGEAIGGFAGGVFIALIGIIAILMTAFIASAAVNMKEGK